ncbi:MAG TPA: murein biosynthesis integral membrane protein MurJ [Candidatus Aquicultor sp.]|jgi:putative peptidoglycan lipid II flippase
MSNGISRGKALALSAITVTVATFLGRIFGFAREMVVAKEFGANAHTDAFLTAFTIPSFIYSLAVMGALSASFIPIFSGLIANDKERDAWRLASSIFNLLLIGFGAITAILMAFAPQAIYIIAPGFGSSDQLTLAANLLRLMAPALIFMGISGLMAGILNSYNHFAAPSLVALAQNVIVVASILVFAKEMGLYGAALGLLLGSIAMVLVQLPVFIKRKLPLLPSFTFKHESLADIGKLFVPVLIALAASQSNTVIDKWMASFLAHGSISYLNYAFKVGSLPLNTLIAAIAIVLFPTLSRHAATGDMVALKSSVSLGIRMICLVAIPASVVLFVLSMPITRLLFENGAFSRTATIATSSALAVYAFGLLAMGLNMLLVRAFYSLKDGVTPLIAALVFVVALIVLDFPLRAEFAHTGLAIGYVLASCLMAVVLMWRLSRRLGGLHEAQLVTSFSKTLVAACVMGVVTWFAATELTALLGAASKLHELAIVACATIAGAGAYGTTLILLRTDEITMLWNMIKSRVSRTEPQTAG